MSYFVLNNCYYVMLGDLSGIVQKIKEGEI